MKTFDSQITFIYTRDLETASAFYGDLLELPLVLDQGGCRIYRVAQGGFIGVCGRGEAPEPQGVILTLVTDDVDEWFHRLVAAGTVVEKKPAYNPDYNIYHCFLLDPAGYRIEIQRFEGSTWNDSLE